jgi:thioredoxin reductase
MNKRTDRYGGTFNNRLSFILEIIHCVRDNVGDDYPIVFRFSADEHVSGGTTPEDSVRLAVELENAGVDAINVTSGIYESKEWIFPPMATEPGYNIHLAAKIKSVVTIPIIVVGKLGNHYLSSSVVDRGDADFIALGRSLVADPLLPDKWRKGKYSDVVPCIGCNECIVRVARQWPIRCTVNPVVGRESQQKKTISSKGQSCRKNEVERILVIGGGPAGMHAALSFACLGLKTILCERCSQLGGNLRYAALPPQKREIELLLDSMIHRIRSFEQSIEVSLDTEIDAGGIQPIEPDAVVVATGARLKTNIPGDQSTVYSVTEALTETEQLGQNVAVVGGGQCGCEVTEFLANKGKSVMLFEKESELALDMEPIARKILLKRLTRSGIKIRLRARVKQFLDGEVTLVDENENDKTKYDSIVACTGWIPNDDLFRQIRSQFSIPVLRVGDCVSPRNIYHAIHEGDRVASQLNLPAF